MMSEAQLCELAQKLAPFIEPPLCIYLQGDLGTGKTTFVRALLRALGYEAAVKSPTYGLMERYRLDCLDVVHLDLYRLADRDELEFLALPDQLSERSLLLVEWPPASSAWLPPADLVISFDYSGDKRRVSFKTYTSSGIALGQLIQSLL